jgi:hypothetical protein
MGDEDHATDSRRAGILTKRPVDVTHRPKKMAAPLSSSSNRRIQFREERDPPKGEDQRFVTASNKPEHSGAPRIGGFLSWSTAPDKKTFDCLN